MKFLITMIFVLVSSQAFSISHKEFVRLKKPQRELVIKAYKEFLAQYSKTIEISSSRYQTFPELISSAHATEYTCIYAGWPSSRVNGKCAIPTSNPALKNESCGENEIPCQPMLFGRGLCVSTATPSDRRRAFANCEKKFKEDERDLAQVIDYISEPARSAQADELFRLLDDICTNKTQSSTPMCRNLKAKIENIKAERPATEVAAPTAPTTPTASTSTTPERALTVAVQGASQVTATVENLNTATRCETCESQRAQTVDEPQRVSVRGPLPYVEPQPNTQFPRIESGFSLASCGGQNGMTDGYGTLRVFNCQDRNDQGVFSGFNFRQDPATHPYLRGILSPYGGNGYPARFWSSISVNQAFNETYLIMEETAGGPDSHNVKSYMYIVPRKTVPSTRIEGDDIVTTLATGETVTMNKFSRAITGGALTEGPIDLNMNRHERKPPNIHYAGTGISIRLNHRYEHPLTSSETAVVKQGTKTCNVPRTALFNSDGKLTTTTDADLLAVINRSCRGGGFSLP